MHALTLWNSTAIMHAPFQAADVGGADAIYGTVRTVKVKERGSRKRIAEWLELRHTEVSVSKMSLNLVCCLFVFNAVSATRALSRQWTIAK